MNNKEIDIKGTNPEKFCTHAKNTDGSKRKFRDFVEVLIGRAEVFICIKKPVDKLKPYVAV